jgi:hypothetical protein
MKTSIEEFDHNEGPGLMYPLVWYFVFILALASVVAIVRWVL